jgi:hypothetical protein
MLVFIDAFRSISLALLNKNPDRRLGMAGLLLDPLLLQKVQ